MIAEPVAWIADQGDGPFSFESVCHTLHVDPSALRRKDRSRGRATDETTDPVHGADSRPDAARQQKPPLEPAQIAPDGLRDRASPVDSR